MNKKAMVGFRGYVIGVMLIILFIFFVYSFIGSFTLATNPNSEIMDSKWGINSTTQLTNSTLNNIKDNIELNKGDLSGAEVSPIDYLFLISRAFFTIPIAVFNFIIGGIALLPTILFSGLGGTGMGDLLVFGLAMLISVMTITIILLTIKLVRTGVDN